MSVAYKCASVETHLQTSVLISFYLCLLALLPPSTAPTCSSAVTSADAGMPEHNGLSTLLCALWMCMLQTANCKKLISGQIRRCNMHKKPSTPLLRYTNYSSCHAHCMISFHLLITMYGVKWHMIAVDLVHAPSSVPKLSHGSIIPHC